MKKLASVITNPWVISLVGELIVSALIWIVAPMVSIAGNAILEGDVARWGVTCLLTVVWGGLFVFARWRRNKASNRLEAEITAPKPAGAANGAIAELSQLSIQMKQSLGYLKKAYGGSRGQYLYQIPWYVIVGPPGSGKSTALKNCGLRFPLETVGALQGVGGTRNCDWWFTEQAVFLDTAGRYITQDSNAGADQAEWLGFLDILKKHRRRQPVNGVLVAISISDVLRFSESERKANAQAIRKRIAELNERLGIRPPLYVLFTKMDLVAGFVEFFDDLGKEERAQVWGATLPYDDGTGPQSIERLGAEFDALVSRLGERVIERIHNETDVARRGMVVGFPQQFALLRQPVKDMLEEVFLGNRFEARQLLRGFYFTSGTQLGSPIDRLMGAMAATFGVRPSALPAFSGQGRSYFLSKLLLDVAIPEAGMVGSDRAAERRQYLFRIAAGIAALVFLAGSAAALATSYFGNVGLVDRVVAEADKYRDGAINIDPIGADWREVARVLGQVRGLPTGFDQRDQSVPVSLGLGLYQGDKLGGQAVESYRRALSFLLLPKLQNRLEGQIRANMSQPDFLFEAVQVYLMLGKRVALNRDQVISWYGLDFAANFPAADQEPLRAALADHVAALMDGDLVSLPMDEGLVERALAVLRQIPAAQRAYSLIKQSSLSMKLPEWNPTAKAGPSAGQVFRRLSGKPLTEGVPGLFTRDGFHRVFLPQVPEVAREVLKEASLIGKEQNGGIDAGQKAVAVERDIISLYQDEYARRWDAILSDVTIVPLRSVDHSAEVLNVLGGPASPLKKFILAVADETLLTQPPSGLKAVSAAAVKEAVADNLGKAVKDERLARLLGPGDGGVAKLVPGQPVEDRFRRLREMTQGTPSQLDGVVDTLGRLYRQTSKVAGAGSQGAALLAAAGGGDGNAAQALAGEAANMPPPFNTLLGAVAKSSNALAVGGARTQLNALWQANVAPFCQQATANRYPFTKGTNVDVTVEDFTRLFGPNGLVVQFFNANVARFVDMSRRPWRWQKVDNTELGLSQQTLAQFERAMAINEGFFRGGAALRVAFELVPVSLDASASDVIIDVSGQQMVYAHGPIVPTRMSWPSQTGSAQATLAIGPPVAGKISSIVKDGGWSFFRLLDEASMTPGPVPERFRVGFVVGGRSASFEIRATSVNNPFDFRDLRQFRCPSSL